MYKVWLSLTIFLIGWFILSGCANPQDSSAQTIATPTRGPDLLATSQALSTNIAQNSSLIETAEARKTLSARTPTPTLASTPKEPGTDQTATSLAPVNILDLPIPPGEIFDYFESRNQVTYVTASDFQSLILFFENQMPLNGWRKEIQGSFTTEGSALLHYIRNNQKLSISLRHNSLSQRTTVIISLLN